MTGLALSVCMLLVSSGLTSSTFTPIPAAAHAQVTSPIILLPEEARFVDLTNADRMNARLNPLTVDPVLVAAAREHSREMCEKNYFSHDSPTPSTHTPMMRYLEELGARPQYAMVGENLFYCSTVDVNRGEYAFMHSPPHRENILNPRFDSIGIGVWKGDDGSFWVTEMFLTNRPGS